tara:strand:+ start:220 stop:480 length:261 start_codon:yes stop_codon:yes gene_type:complete
MNVSIEITLIPLQDQYETPIKEFIKCLRASDFKVLENPLSTQIYGAYAPLMIFLTEAIETSFNGLDAGMINLKIVKTDRSAYHSNF